LAQASTWNLKSLQFKGRNNIKKLTAMRWWMIGPGHRGLDRQLPRRKHSLGRRADGTLMLRKGIIDPLF
jgi:hypothetical protein